MTRISATGARGGIPARWRPRPLPFPRRLIRAAPAGQAENERLRKRLAKAEVKLEQTRAALDIMGKAFALLDCVADRSGW